MDVIKLLFGHVFDRIKAARFVANVLSFRSLSKNGKQQKTLKIVGRKEIIIDYYSFRK